VCARALLAGTQGGGGGGGERERVR
jgi:hypothetical protein